MPPPGTDLERTARDGGAPIGEPQVGSAVVGAAREVDLLHLHAVAEFMRAAAAQDVRRLEAVLQVLSLVLFEEPETAGAALRAHLTSGQTAGAAGERPQIRVEPLVGCRRFVELLIRIRQVRFEQPP